MGPLPLQGIDDIVLNQGIFYAGTAIQLDPVGAFYRLNIGDQVICDRHISRRVRGVGIAKVDRVRAAVGCIKVPDGIPIDHNIVRTIAVVNALDISTHIADVINAVAQQAQLVYWLGGDHTIVSGFADVQPLQRYAVRADHHLAQNLGGPAARGLQPGPIHIVIAAKVVNIQNCFLQPGGVRVGGFAQGHAIDKVFRAQAHPKGEFKLMPIAIIRVAGRPEEDVTTF